jgi:adenylate cyclase class IV
MPRNIELKAVLADPAAALARARTLAGPSRSVERQRDTYFEVPRGRLKLRRRWIQPEGGGPEKEQPAELIGYQRPDDREAAASDYRIVPFPPGSPIDEVLAVALGTDAVVEKTRRVFLHDGVRIHLDDVTGLGSFLELEAIVDDGCDDEDARAKVARLRAHFGIREEDLLAASYRELVRTAQ